nr:E3 binding domain-containing protein [Paracoccaceae bacterium]
MEVEAQAGGYLAGVQAGEGDDVPVGDVIALIVDSETEVTNHVSARTTADDDDSDPKVEEASTRDDLQAPEPEATPSAEIANAYSPPRPPLPTGKVLASPKAKRLAQERGIDLSALRAQGIPEPIHAADLARATASGQSLLTALANGVAFDALLDRTENPNRTILLAAFAAGAWRALFDVDEIGVALRSLDGATKIVSNPDRGGGPGDLAQLNLVDLCGTRLTGYGPASVGVTLTAARQSKSYALTLSFAQSSLPAPHAAALLDDIAARIEDPIRQLL